MFFVRDDNVDYRVDNILHGAIIRVERQVIKVNEPVALFINIYAKNGIDIAMSRIKDIYKIKQDDMEVFMEEMIKLFCENDIFLELVRVYKEKLNENSYNNTI